jgi:membrane protease YdiL (CAAX protease family)
VTRKTKILASIAQEQPAVFMVLVTYVWTWSFWFTSLNLVTDPQGLKLTLFLLGGFGPAIGGVLTLRLQSGEREVRKIAMGGFLVGAGLALMALAMFRFDVLGVTSPKNGPGALGILRFPADSPIYVYVLMSLVVLVSGFVFSSIQSSNKRLRSYFAGLLPDGKALLLAIPVILFFPALLISSNYLADLLDMDYPQPSYLQDPMSIWLPLMFVKMFTVAILTGGNEEHGWRGVLQPLLQRSMSPLLVALIIGVIWELWHLPLVVGGIYGEGNAALIVIGRMLAIVPMAFLLATIYNSTRGSIFLCVLCHACMNSQFALFGGSELANLVGILVVIALIVGLRMWRRGSGFVPSGD